MKAQCNPSLKDTKEFWDSNEYMSEGKVDEIRQELAPRYEKPIGAD